MVDTSPTTNDTSCRTRLQQMFDIAAAKNLALICALDAEPEMFQFLHTVIENPSEREFVAQLFLNAFSESFHMRAPPTELIQYCMHVLKWPEVREFIEAQRDQDIEAHGAARSGVWDDILDAFNGKWQGAQYYPSLKTLRCV